MKHIKRVPMYYDSKEYSSVVCFISLALMLLIVLLCAGC